MGPLVLRIMVVGAGTIAQSVHLPAIQAMPDRFQLVGVVDASVERAQEIARRYGTRPYVSMLTGLHESGADAVLISTPGDHAVLAEEALSSRVHVLAEKPLALSRARAEALDRLANEVGCVLWVGYMKMSDPALSTARAALPRLGSLRLVDIRVVHPLDARQVRHIRLAGGGAPDSSLVAAMEAEEAKDLEMVFGTSANWVGRWYPDVLLGSVVHQFSVIRALGFHPPDAYDHVDVWPWPPQDQPPNMLAVARLGTEHLSPRLSLAWVWAPNAGEYRETVRVVGDEGEVTVDLAAPYLVDTQSTVSVVTAENDVTEELRVRSAPVGSFRIQLEAFSSAIEDGGPILSTATGAAEDARSAQALVECLAEQHGLFIPGERLE